MTPESARTRLTRDPSRTALLFDFDGTLAPIVDDPSAAELTAGAFDALAALAERYRRVGVVSGRPVDYLDARLPSTVALSGLYGLESKVDGRRHSDPDAARWCETTSGVAADPTVPDGLRVELKGPSLTVHFRGRDDLAAEAYRWAEGVAAATGLSLRAAKASVELHPPLGASKGTAVRALAEGCDVVSFVGDDVGDLPAFAALDDLAAAGVEVVKVACGSPELPEAVAAAADLTVDGPTAVVGLFDGLVP